MSTVNYGRARTDVTAVIDAREPVLELTGRAGRTAVLQEVRVSYVWDAAENVWTPGRHCFITLADRLKSGELGEPYERRYWPTQGWQDADVIGLLVLAHRPAVAVSFTGDWGGV